MIRSLFCCLLVLPFLGGQLLAQVSNTDSIFQTLSKMPDDTSKVQRYWDAGVSVIYQDPAKAIPFFRSGSVLADKLGFVSGQEKTNNALSLAFSFIAKYDSAIIYINKAVGYAVKAGNIRRLSLAYLNRADVLVNLQDYPGALKDCDSAIVYAQKIGNNDALGRIYSIMNGVFRDLKQFDKAFAALDKSDYYFSFTKNRQMVAMNYSERGGLLLSSKQPEKAVEWYKRAIFIADSLQDISNLSAYNCEMGEAMSQLKRSKEAKAYFLKALGYARQTENNGQESVCLSDLSDFELEQGNFNESIEYGLQAYELMKPETDLLREQHIVNTLAKAYLKLGDVKKGYEFLQISNTLKDSLVAKQFSEETARQQALFDVKEKEREILVLNKEKEVQEQRFKTQRVLIWGAAFVVMLSLLATWLLVNRSRLKQRMKELELRNQIAADLHDEVGSSLSSIHMLSQMASKAGNEMAHQQILERMSSNAQETMEKMSDIVWMIKPGESESGSLKGRMERFAQEIGGSRNIDIDLDLGILEQVDLNMEQRKNLWLIFKEAVNNAVKYSSTSKLEIVASLQGQLLQIWVRDFGKGFDKNLIKKGNGLDNMQHRAKELLATLTIDSKVDTGTTILLTMPIS